MDVVLTRYPNHAVALQIRARWLVLDGRPAQALEQVTLAVNAAPRDAGAVYLRGTLQALTGQHAAAVKSFNEVLQLNPRAAAAQVQLAQLNLLAGRAESASGLAAEAVSRAPGLPEARLVLARALVAQREFARADAEIGRLLAVFPRAASVLSLKATLQLLRGDAGGARTAYQAAFDAEPGSIAALTGLSLLDMKEQLWDAARRRVEARMAVEPKRTAVLLVAAKVYAGSRDLAGAERVLRQAIQLSPTVVEAYALLGEVFREQGKLDAALGEFDAVVARDATNVPARTMAAMIVHAQQRSAEAKRRYEELLAVEPRAVVAANNLAWIYADEKQNLDRAVQLAQSAAEQSGDFPEAWDTLGWVYLRKQLPLLAVEPIERAIAQNPENATFRYHLGLALVGAGDRSRSRDALEMALKLQPDFPDASRELAALAQ
jgi:tetratricopeptide (TPR) repeat protein